MPDHKLDRGSVVGILTGPELGKPNSRWKKKTWRKSWKQRAEQWVYAGVHGAMSLDRLSRDKC